MKKRSILMMSRNNITEADISTAPFPNSEFILVPTGLETVCISPKAKENKHETLVQFVFSETRVTRTNFSQIALVNPIDQDEEEEKERAEPISALLI